MKTRTRWLAGLALAGLLGSATASLAQKGDEETPRRSDREIGPFVRAGRSIVNVGRIESIDIQPLDNGDSILTIYLIGRHDSAARVGGKDAADLLRAMGVPPIERAKPAP